MNQYKAFFSDGTKEYCSPTHVKPNETLTIRLRTPKFLAVKPLLLDNYAEITMELAEVGNYFDYYECSLTMTSGRLTYAFKVVYEGRIFYYTKKGLSDYYDWQDSFFVLPSFDYPDWAMGAVMYQIYTDRFYNGDKSNDVEDAEYYYADQAVEHVFDWKSPVANLDVARFYGGDLVGVRKKLDYLQELGVEVLYLNPIFVSPSNHKYDCQDYDHVDPHLTVISKKVGDPGVYGYNKYVVKTTYEENLEASNKWFADFMQEVHNRGMKVVLDGVFNHCGSFNKWLDREGYYSACEAGEAGAYRDKNSKYRDFFKFANPDDNNSYEGWWGFDTLPKLNYEGSEELCKYICEIGKKWVSPPYNCDGWRLDVAADLGHSAEFNHYFWQRFRKAVKEANPNAIIYAEHYGEAGSWLNGNEWDTLMNYDGFMEPLTWFLTGMEKHSDEYNDYMLNNTDVFADSLMRAYCKYSPGTFYTAMNELSNHDHSRFLTRTNRVCGRVQYLGSEAAEQNIRPAVFREAVIFQMTWPGAPTIYYGDEAGLCGFTDPDCRRTYPWHHENMELLDFHREIVNLRNRLPVLKNGSLAIIHKEYGVFGFARFDREDIVVTIINNNESERTLEVDLSVADFWVPAMVTLLISDREGSRREAIFHHIEDSRFSITLPAEAGVILKNLKN